MNRKENELISQLDMNKEREFKLLRRAVIGSFNPQTSNFKNSTHSAFGQTLVPTFKLLVPST